VAAYDEETRHAFVLENEHGLRATPTWLAFTNSEILVGEDAKNQAHRNAENTFFGFTCLLGIRFEDHVTRALQRSSHFQIDNRNGKPVLYAPSRQRAYSPEELTAFLIKKMVRIAEAKLELVIPSVEISVHSALGTLRLEALHRAAALSDVVVRLSPTKHVGCRLEMGIRSSL
jgi:molecular chaperone DnaK (HSP70)